MHHAPEGPHCALLCWAVLSGKIGVPAGRRGLSEDPLHLLWLLPPPLHETWPRVLVL